MGLELALRLPLLDNEARRAAKTQRRTQGLQKLYEGFLVFQEEAAAAGEAWATEPDPFLSSIGSSFENWPPSPPAPPRPPPPTCTLDTAVGCDTGVARGLTLQIIAEMNAEPAFQKDGYVEQLVEQPTTGPGPHLGCAGDACNPIMTEAAGLALLAAIEAQTGQSKLELNSAFRSSAQQYLLHQWHSRGECNIGAVATVGTSNHEGGNALDMNSADVATWRAALESNGWTWYCTERNRGFATGCISLPLPTCNNPTSWRSAEGEQTECDGQRTPICPCSTPAHPQIIPLPRSPPSASASALLLAIDRVVLVSCIGSG